MDFGVKGISSLGSRAGRVESSRSPGVWLVELERSRLLARLMKGDVDDGRGLPGHAGDIACRLVYALSSHLRCVRADPQRPSDPLFLA